MSLFFKKNSKTLINFKKYDKKVYKYMKSPINSAENSARGDILERQRAKNILCN